MSGPGTSGQRRAVLRPLPAGKAPAMANETNPNSAEGLPAPGAQDSEDPSRDRDPHHALNTPVGEPDPTEWPDPYDHRPDPRDPESEGMPFAEVHPPTGAHSTSEPHPKQDPEAEPWAEGPKRDKVDE
jgi:hypothetical protein